MIRDLILSNAELATLTNGAVNIVNLQPGSEFVDLPSRCIVRVVDITKNTVNCIKVMDLYLNTIPANKQKQIAIGASSAGKLYNCWDVIEFKQLMQNKLQSLLSNF